METENEQLRGADAVVRTLRDHGVDTVFGMCGHGDLAFLDAMLEQGVRFVTVHHEQVAVHAADAYYRTTGRPGVVITTVGSGMLNTVTALADATADSSAVLVISGLAPSRYVGLGAYQELDLNGDDEQWLACRPVVKRSIRVLEPMSLPDVVAQALAETTAGCPGPVHVHVPLDFWYTRGDYGRPAVATIARPALSAATVAAVADQIRASRRPVIFAGGGVLNAGAQALLREFAEAIDAPVVTSMRGQGALAQDHPLEFGFTGVVGSGPANHAVQNADLVIGLATRFDEMDTSSWSVTEFLDPARTSLVHIDIDQRRIGRHFPVAVGGIADVGQALGQLVAEFAQDRQEHGPWLSELAERRQSWLATLAASFGENDDPIQIAGVVKSVQETMPEDCVLVAGVGARHIIGQTYKVKEGGALLTASGCGTMGWETGAVLGAAVAESVGGRRVIGLLGDGAFNSTVTALATAISYEVDAVWLVMDNGGYQSIAMYQDRHFGRRVGTDFAYVSGGAQNIDYVALARAYGGDGEVARTQEEIRAAVRRGLERGGSYLIQVPTDGKPKANATGHWDVNDIMQGDTARVPQPWRRTDESAGSR